MNYPTPDDQTIINAGTTKAQELGLNPLPLIGNGIGNKFTIPAGTTVTYDRNGKWIFGNDDLIINATQRQITIEGVTIPRGKWATKKNGIMTLVED